jgi:hypothetical protein
MSTSVLAEHIQTFFVPKEICGLRLSGLPMSAALASACKKLKIASFGDLSGLSLKDFKSVSSRSTTLVVEFRELIQRARNGEFTAVLS